MKKIITLDQLNSIKRGGRKLVLVGGCFDIFHIGHLRFLSAAKKAGDILIVTLEPDKKVRTLKGVNRPINSQKERAEILAALQMTDYIVLLPEFKTDADYANLIKTIRPQVIAITEDDPIKIKKRIQAKSVNGKLLVIPKTETPSTTELTKLLSID